MGKLSTEDTQRVADLAKLQLTKAETDKFTKQLSMVLAHMDELEEVDVKGVEPTAQVEDGLTNVLGEDITDPTRCLTQEEALSGTENTQNGYFRVRPILDRSS